MLRPVVLGTGLRLFERSEHVQRLRLNQRTVNTKGVSLASYEPVGDAAS